MKLNAGVAARTVWQCGFNVCTILSVQRSKEEWLCMTEYSRVDLTYQIKAKAQNVEWRKESNIIFPGLLKN